MMWRITLPIVLLVTFVLSGLSCRRSSPIPPPSLTGQLVEYPGCGHFIVKVLSGPIPDSSVLNKSWTDTQTDSTFTNVFTVRNWVTMQQAGLSAGSIFTFTLNGPITDTSTYFTCAVLPYTMPTATNNVTNIVKLP